MKFWRKYHKWGGLVLSFFLLLFALSGIVLNHRQVFSSIDVPRGILSSSYQYKNWNSAALKGSVEIDSTQSLFYGNVGCWLYDKTADKWLDYNTGFPKGTDGRKVAKVIKTNSNSLFAGTLFGLYEHNNGEWQYIDLGIDHQRITDLIEVNDTLHILTRSEIAYLNLTQPNDNIKISLLPTPADYQGTTSLFKTIWVLHSGEILGLTGKILVDLLALVFVFLIITGLVWTFFPSLIKRAKKKKKQTKNKRNGFRFSVKWHNRIGIYTLVFLVFITFTGMFLRPPLLIAIANVQVKNIPYTLLDSPNAWYDQLRGIRYNSELDTYFVSTGKGMYALSADRQKMERLPHQPPVSVMGINVFEEKSNNNYLIGSFSGLYLWSPIDGSCYNYVTGKPHVPTKKMARPIGRYMASGYHASANTEYYFDYSGGVKSLKEQADFPQMPDAVKQASPLSLWNLALEIHTARIFQDVIGAFYILIIPLAGITTLILLLSGFWIWLKKY